MRSKGMMAVLMVVALMVALVGGCAKPTTTGPSTTDDVPIAAPLKWITPEELANLPLGEVELVGKVPMGNLATLSGTASATLSPMCNFEINFFKDVNERGGIRFIDPNTGKASRVLIELHWLDGEHLPKKGVEIYKKILPSHPAVISCCASSYTEVIYKLCEKDQVPLVTYGLSTGDELFYDGTWVFGSRMLYADAFLGTLEYMKSIWTESRPIRLAYWSVDNPYGRGCWNAQSRAYVEQDPMIELVAEKYDALTSFDYTSSFLAIKNANVDFIFAQGIGYLLGLAVKTARGVGVEAPILTEHDALETIPFELAGVEAMEGVTGWYPYTLLSEAGVPGVQYLLELTEKYNAPAVHNSCQQSLAQEMICAEGIRGALTKNGYPITGKDVRDHLVTIQNLDTMGISEPGGYTEKARRFQRMMRMCQAQNGEWVAITDWISAVDSAPEGFKWE